MVENSHWTTDEHESKTLTTHGRIRTHNITKGRIPPCTVGSLPGHFRKTGEKTERAFYLQKKRSKSFVSFGIRGGLEYLFSVNVFPWGGEGLHM